jgi:betaine-homocysteine S-methyltransferase
MIALDRAKATGLPIMVTMSYEKDPHTYEGHTPAEAARTLADAGADVVGINCLRNPENTLPLMREVRDAVTGFVACQPVAYRTPPDQPDFTALPEFPFGLDPLQLSRQEMAAFAVEAKDIGVNYVGACCGTIASHVREMAKALGKREREDEALPWHVDYERPMSAYEYYGHATEQT